MSGQERKIEFYKTSLGKKPFQEWLDALKDKPAKAKIRARLDRVILGNLGHCRPVGSGVTELKIDFGPGYRVYFGQVADRLIILLCGGDKGTQSKDIKRAQEYWVDYKKRLS